MMSAPCDEKGCQEAAVARQPKRNWCGVHDPVDVAAAARADIRSVIHTMKRFRESAEHYYENGNKHRNLKALRKQSSHLLSRLVARWPEEAKAALHTRIKELGGNGGKG